MPQRARKKMQNNVEITIKTEQAEKTFEGKCLTGALIQENMNDGKRSTQCLMVGIASHGEILQGIAASSAQIIDMLSEGDPVEKVILFQFLKDEMKKMLDPREYEILEEIVLTKGAENE